VFVAKLLSCYRTIGQNRYKKKFLIDIMGDIDVTVQDLNDLIANLLGSTKKSPYANNVPNLSLLHVSFNVTSQPLDEMVSSKAQEKFLYTERKDPLIDVIETKDQIRVIATLPGIKNEDVWFDLKHGVLTVEIIQYGQILKKQIKCDTKPGQILIKSSKVNNSVLEIIFDKV
jgi:HSP20 family molecular chaperone IbpA